MPKKRGILNVSAKYWYGCLAFCLLVPWLAYTFINFRHIYYRYTPYTPQIRISIEEWWKDPLNYLPFYRENRFGNPFRPFNIQWVENLENIKNLLVKHGWKELQGKVTVKTTFKHFVSQEPEYQLPLLAQLYQNKPPAVIFYKYFANHQKIIILRLWTSNVKFVKNSFPLWIGELNYQKAKYKLAFFIHHDKVLVQFHDGSQKLMTDLTAYQKKIITVPKNQLPPHLQRIDWDGKILVIKPKVISKSR